MVVCLFWTVVSNFEQFYSRWLNDFFVHICLFDFLSMAHGTHPWTSAVGQWIYCFLFVFLNLKMWGFMWRRENRLGCCDQADCVFVCWGCCCVCGPAYKVCACIYRDKWILLTSTSPSLPLLSLCVFHSNDIHYVRLTLIFDRLEVWRLTKQWLHPEGSLGWWDILYKPS